MRKLVLALALPLAAIGAEVSAPRLPPWGHPGTEVSANVSIASARADVRAFDVAVDFSGTPSNCVQVAFGRDADGDGDLSPDETGLVLGWRAGRCFVEGRATGERFEEPAPADAAPVRSLTLHVETDADCVPRSARASVGAAPLFTSVLAQCPAWLFDGGWDVCKVTRRGVDEPQEFCRVSKSFGHFNVRVR